MPTRKQCSECAEVKPMDCFARRNRVTGVRPPRWAYGRDGICRACRSHLRKPSLRDERRKRRELDNQRLKLCPDCGLIKPYAEYHVRRASADGIAFRCKACVNVATHLWRSKHPNRHKDWYRENSDKRKLYGRAWRRENRERLRESYKQWAQANKDKVNANIAKRYTLKRHCTPRWVKQAWIRPFYTAAAHLTKTTGVRHEVDHIVPIRSKIVCGLHVPANLQILTTLENKRKANNHDPLAPANSAASTAHFELTDTTKSANERVSAISSS